MKKINIGFDIGVASVGWSVIDENHNIIDMGVRLFDDVADGYGKLANEKRRAMRCSRRRLRRAKTRKQAYENLLVKYNWVESNEEARSLFNIDITKFGVSNPIELKCLALKQKISKEALIYILFHYLHHRGYFYVTEEDLDVKKDLNLKNEQEVCPSEEILKFYKENHYYKDSKIPDNFSARQYEAEIRKILQVQNVDQNFIDEYLGDKVFNAVRSFDIGPGSKKSPTPYGMWYINENNEVVKREGETLYDSLKGKCTYYPDETRGGKYSPIAEIFNLLNDINNIRLYTKSGQELDESTKKIIFEKYSEIFTKEKVKAFNLNEKELVKILSKNTQIVADQIFGYRVDKQNKKIITELKSYNQIVQWLVKNKLWNEPVNILNIDLLKKANEIFELLSSYVDVRKRLKVLNEKYPDSPEANDELVKKLKGLTQTHSLSYKAMLEFINYCINNISSNNNQMVYFNSTINEANKNIVFSNNNKYLSKLIFDNEVISPTAKRAFIQTIRVMNKLMKKYKILHDKQEERLYQIDNITFELPRDKNSAEERKSITDGQKKNEAIIEQIIKEENINKNVNELNAKQKLKLKLWYQQNKRDIYDQSYISVDEVLYGNGLDIDHIVPFSISHDDSLNNKVLTSQQNNRLKGNRTPYQWLSEQGKFENFVSFVDKITTNSSKEQNGLNKEKVSLLKSISDPSSDEELYGFIGKNLSDTRYASSLVMNTFQNYFNKNNAVCPNVKIKVIRGSMTNFARYYIFTNNQADAKTLLPKDRDVYCHHAIDASIICWLGMNHQIKTLLNWYEGKLKNSDTIRIDHQNKKIINDKTGEVINLTESFAKKDENVVKFGQELSKYNTRVITIVDGENKKKELEYGELAHKVGYSRMYTTKKNSPLSNETIYSIKWKGKENPLVGNLVTKLDLIGKNTSDLDKYFRQDKNKDAEKLFCYKYDKHLYDELFKIYNKNYDGKVNPFIKYMQDNYENFYGKTMPEKWAPRWVQVGNQRVKKIRLEDDEVNAKKLIVLEHHKNNAVLKSLECLQVRIYKTFDNKFIAFPINQKVLDYDKNSRKLKINEEKLSNLLQQNNIDNSNYVLINNGSIFIKKQSNQMYYSIGSTTNNLIELKSLTCKNELMESRSRCQFSLFKIINEFDICEVDELGRIYNRKSFNDLLK